MMLIHLDCRFICKLCDQSFIERKVAAAHIIKEHEEHRAGTKGWCRHFIRNICRVIYLFYFLFIINLFLCVFRPVTLKELVRTMTTI